MNNILTDVRLSAPQSPLPLGLLETRETWIMNHVSAKRISIGAALLVIACLFPLRAATTKQGRGEQQTESAGWAAIHIPLFLESGGYQSVLTLNNNRPEQIEMEVEIFGPGGERGESVPVEIPAMTTTERPLAGLLSRNVPFGSLELRYQGVPLEATAQVTVSSNSRRVSFESPETHPAQSRRLDSILRLAEDGAKATVALTNLTDDPLSATLTGTGRGASRRVVRLKARETRLIEASRFVAAEEGTVTGLLGVEHDGAIGALAATGFVLDERTGFSSTLTFSDPATARSSRLSAADFRVGPPPPEEGFPPDVSFQAELTLANRGDSPLQAMVFVNYTKDGVKGRIEAADVDLPPSELRSLDLNETLLRSGVAGPVQEAGLDILYDGPPGALLAKLASRDGSGDYSLDYPVKDPEEAVHTGGSYPWRLDAVRRTVVHFKNTTERDGRVFLQIRWAGGSYTPEAVPLGPWESVSLDLERLRASGEPDISGATLPEEAQSGQLVWYTETRGALIGRAEVKNDRMGMASSFSCEPICCGLVRKSDFMDPGSAVDVVGGEGNSFIAKETRQDCYGIVFGPYDMGGQSQWMSSAPSIATVSSGHVTCVSPGTAGITASFNSIVGFASYPSPCFAIVAGGVVGASILVNACEITNFSVTSPDGFLINTTPQMPTINGSVSVNPTSAAVSWQAQIVFTAPSITCSGGPAFDSPVKTGSGTTFSPNFGGFYGGGLQISASCESETPASETFPIGGSDPGKTAIQAAIGNAPAGVDSGDLKRIACLESGQKQFDGTGFPILGSGGDAGIMQICFQRTASDLWNWRTNIDRGKAILGSSISFAQGVPGKVRTQTVRNMGPFPNATNFTSDQLRRESIHAFNAGNNINTDGYWQWNNVAMQWTAAPQGGQANYVDLVLGRSPSCP